jgi:hypothetical protein
MIVWFNGTVSFMRVCATKTDHINRLSAVYSSLDVWARDIRKAPRSVYAWHVMSDTSCVITLSDSSSIGWEYKDGALVRYHGVYEADKKEWIKKNKSLVLDGAHACSFHYAQSDQEIISVVITCNVKGTTFSRVSYLFN